MKIYRLDKRTTGIQCSGWGKLDEMNRVWQARAGALIFYTSSDASWSEISDRVRRANQQSREFTP
jgi:hypothetical protein